MCGPVARWRVFSSEADFLSLSGVNKEAFMLDDPPPPAPPAPPSFPPHTRKRWATGSKSGPDLMWEVKPLHHESVKVMLLWENGNTITSRAPDVDYNGGEFSSVFFSICKDLRFVISTHSCGLQWCGVSAVSHGRCWGGALGGDCVCFSYGFSSQTRARAQKRLRGELAQQSWRERNPAKVFCVVLRTFAYFNWEKKQCFEKLNEQI